MSRGDAILDSNLVNTAVFIMKDAFALYIRSLVIIRADKVLALFLISVIFLQW